jgi:hypothetical protein
VQKYLKNYEICKSIRFVFKSYHYSSVTSTGLIVFFGRGSISFHRLPIHPITPMGFQWHAQPRKGAGKIGGWWSMLNGQLAGWTTSRNPCRQTKTNSDLSPSGAMENTHPPNFFKVSQEDDERMAFNGSNL